MTSISEERITVTEGSLGLTVTGVDAKGHIFRERTAVLSLDGRDCEYASGREVQTGSWVLLDIDYAKAGQKSCRVQGQVKSVQPLRTAHGQFRVAVELEVAQSVRVVPNDGENQVETKAPEPPVALTEPKGWAETAPPSPAPAFSTQVKVRTLPHPSIDEGAAAMAQGRELLASIQTQVLTMVREEVKSAVLSEIDQHLAVLRNSLSGEVEKAAQATAASRLEEMVRDAVEKQISQKYQTSIQALECDLTDQLVGRLAESEQCRASFQAIAKDLAERLTELSQSAAAKAEQDLNARVTAIRRLFEETIAETQRRINNHRADLEATLARAQASGNESAGAALRVEEALERLKEADRTTMERLNERFLAHLDAWSAEFNKRLDRIVVERAAGFVSEVEDQLIPHLQNADETLEKLAAGLQLAQGSLRLQQERLAELARTAAANFEKEIKTLLLRLAGDV